MISGHWAVKTINYFTVQLQSQQHISYVAKKRKRRVYKTFQRLKTEPYNKAVTNYFGLKLEMYPS